MKKPSFFSEFLANAGQVGSIVPSSVFLTRTMLPATLPWDKMLRIAELGPGTGVFTRHLQLHRSPDSRLYLFEQNESFRESLRHRYPGLPVLDDALRLDEVVREEGLPFDLIVSGLPFANFSDDLQSRLLQAIHDALAPDGSFVAFQYTPLLKKKFKTYFPSMETDYTWMNVPPAWVFRCKKTDDARQPVPHRSSRPFGPFGSRPESE
ncbi:class I SAM-dependent methyltransferase [Paenibacillus flagellatus]|uniref:Phospholipid methyltransferase n=1 Tax=Paenibacillus flagellatus TaxID=2211139 RepID=A0A2V5KKV2_9BACL|nr:methyltransferase [Paenibacillus flagellatus]PYI55460.1 phospholipid methyltransferase [Paenibacillus flagellatus]